ncbi:hypothetical protein Hanom_Chr17g01553571 [Helianthus anomalus]
MMTRKMHESTTGTHAPSRNLIKDAEKYIISIEPKKNINPRAKKTLFRQHRTITSDIRQVVTNITVITAKPVHKPKKQTSILFTKTAYAYRQAATNIYLLHCLYV